MTKVRLPVQLMEFAKIPAGKILEFDATSLTEVFDQLELAFPQLRGTLRDPNTKTRRPYIRIFAQQIDLSDIDPSSRLSEDLIEGIDDVHFVTAISGG